MNRIALDLGIIKIYWYSLFILLGMISAFFVIKREIKKNDLPTEKIFDMAFYAIIFGLIGARIYYVLFNLEYYLNYPLEIIQVYKGGLAIHGGLLAGSITILYFTKKHKLDTVKILDIIVVGLILGQAIGRWGNFFNQEAFGPVTSLETLQKMHLPSFIIEGMYINGHFHIPTFLYESLWNLLGFIFLVIIRKNKKLKVGTLSSCYLIWYSLGRYYIESLRTDSLMFSGLKVAQLISIILIIIGIILIIASIKKNENYHNIEKTKRKDKC